MRFSNLSHDDKDVGSGHFQAEGMVIFAVVKMTTFKSSDKATVEIQSLVVDLFVVLAERWQNGVTLVNSECSSIPQRCIPPPPKQRDQCPIGGFSIVFIDHLGIK